MNWINITPESTLLATVVLFLVMACLRPNPRRNYFLAASMAALTVVVTMADISASGDLYNGIYRIDLFSQVFKILLSLGLFLVVVLCNHLSGVAPERHAEVYLLLALCTLAMMMLASSMHLLVIFLSLELSSYSLYLLVYLRRESHWGLIAGLRYFLVGASASAIMLFGLALVYAVTGQLYLDPLMTMLPGMIQQPMVVIGILLTLAGFFFKLAVFPFHFWAPEAYQGAPNQVAAFIATASKVAAVAILLRMVSLTQGNSVVLVKGLILLAVIAMTVGNLAAIVQRDFKRLMAFSSVAQAGYLLIGLLCMNTAGYTGAMFYAGAILVMKFTCFLVMILVAEDGGNLQIADLAGLHRRSPLLAFALMLGLFGLAGIPPTIGFSGKWMIFMAAMEKGYLVLVLIAMANVAISLYYYLLVLKAAYLDEPDHEQPAIKLNIPVRLIALALIMIIVGVGFYPTAWLDLVQRAALTLP